jgi:predicted O-linked N-acetylglucosamine transferase (SPINDLY family)
VAEATAAAARLHQQGQIAEAESLCRAILKAAPTYFPAQQFLGALSGLQGRYAEAAALLEAALQQAPDNADARYNLGLALLKLDRSQEAVAQFEQAIHLDPTRAEAYNNLGCALVSLNRHREALAPFQRAVEVKPDHVEAMANLASALQVLDLHKEATAWFERALALERDHVGTQLGLATIAREHGALDRARAFYERVLAKRPDHVIALVSLANLLVEQNRHDEAAARYRQALALEPDIASARQNLGTILAEQGKLGEAAQQYERAVTIDPAFATAHLNLGATFAQQGKSQAALAEYGRAFAANPKLAAARFAVCTGQLPVLYRDEADIERQRAAYSRELERLSAEIAAEEITDDLAEAVGSNLPFYLPYQGRNDRELQAVFGSLVCGVMAKRYTTAPMPDTPSANDKIRVGIVSGFFREHTVWKLMLRGWLNQLDRRRFRLFGYHTGTARDAVTSEAAALCERFRLGPLSTARWRDAILADEPHIVIYPEIGMDKIAGRLAAMRLAPVQCLSWGHPNTTGYPTLDYFLSSELMEPADGQAHYTERLVRLPNLSIHYEPIAVMPASIDRSALGFRDDAVIYWCGQSLYKYLPQYDRIYPLIAREVGNCQFAFIRYPKGDDVTALFRQRLRDVFAEHGLNADDHCVFLPFLKLDGFVAAMGLSDVYLDSIGWSGGNTTLESLAHDLPIVTTPTEFMRGRHSAAILRMMGIDDTIADTVEGFAAIAVRLARDRAWRDLQRRRIADNKHRCYRDLTAIGGLENFLERAVRGAPSS